MKIVCQAISEHKDISMQAAATTLEDKCSVQSRLVPVLYVKQF